VLLIGLMSGTSLDGIDAALIDIDGDVNTPAWKLLAFAEQSYSAAQRMAIHDAFTGNAATLCRINADLGEWFADAARNICNVAGVDTRAIAAIGSHGQTIWHEPPTDGRRGATLQLGCAATIAERTGITVISDFRSRDMAAGGHGAPLVPWADRLLFSHARKRRVLQNIGGMANLTWLPPRRSSDPLLAFDTGPGNALIDAAVEIATGGASSFDRDGEWAAEAAPDGQLLRSLLANEYFERTPPKSTGRELFGRALVQALVDERKPSTREEWAVLIATLTELTARSIGDAIERWLMPRGVDEVIITGGGALNPSLVKSIARRLAPVAVHADRNALGLDPSAKEAVAFAALAWAHLRGVPGNETAATGAAGPRVLGSRTPGAQTTQQSKA
jgi:anhydro-N-acetylmuramic acid kinase